MWCRHLSRLFVHRDTLQHCARSFDALSPNTSGDSRLRSTSVDRSTALRSYAALLSTVNSQCPAGRFMKKSPSTQKTTMRLSREGATHVRPMARSRDLARSSSGRLRCSCVLSPAHNTHDHALNASRGRRAEALFLRALLSLRVFLRVKTLSGLLFSAPLCLCVEPAFAFPTTRARSNVRHTHRATACSGRSASATASLDCVRTRSSGIGLKREP